MQRGSDGRKTSSAPWQRRGRFLSNPIIYAELAPVFDLSFGLIILWLEGWNRKFDPLRIMAGV